MKNKIAGYRKMLGLSQEGMAKELGISKQSYWMREKGEISFNDSEKIKIKNMLLPLFPKITIDEIFF